VVIIKERSGILSTLQAQGVTDMKQISVSHYKLLLVLRDSAGVQSG